MSIDELITELLAMKEKHPGDTPALVMYDGEPLSVLSVSTEVLDPETYPEDYNMPDIWVALNTVV
jgi:hypothetical protein